MKVLNLTQHNATESQIKDGVFEPTPKDKELIKELLTFNDLPNKQDIFERSEKLSIIASTYGVERIMIGGAPYLLSELERTLKSFGMIPVYAFSKRVNREVEKDGKVTKINVFEHLGFVEV